MSGVSPFLCLSDGFEYHSVQQLRVNTVIRHILLLYYLRYCLSGLHVVKCLAVAVAYLSTL